SGPDRDVCRPRRAVQVVPLPEPALLPLDDRDALAREDEEALLVRLRVVEARRLTRPEDVHADAEQRRARRRRLEAAPGPAALDAFPADLREVQDEPAVVRGHESRVGALELRLVRHTPTLSPTESVSEQTRRREQVEQRIAVTHD